MFKYVFAKRKQQREMDCVQDLRSTAVSERASMSGKAVTRNNFSGNP